MKQVWVIDDDEEMARAIALMLGMLDCAITIFYSARPAVQSLLSGNRPDLMIVDVNMPEVSGLDLVEFLRRRREWKDLPLVMLSSEAADTMIDKALRLGADTYMLKPITIDELERALSVAFSRHSTSE